MERRYKIVLYNRNIYKEIELNPGTQEISVGTESECDERFYKELFFERIRLSFRRQEDDSWLAVCSDNLYFNNPAEKDVSKPIAHTLTHGDLLELKYRGSDSTAISIEFLIDFDSGKQKYNRMIDLRTVDTLEIGEEPQCRIQLLGRYINGDRLTLSRRGEGYELSVGSSAYGVYYNGCKVRDRVFIRDGDFFSVSEYFFFYKKEKLYTEIRGDIRICDLRFEDNLSSDAYPCFRRSTRIREKLNEEPIPVLDPPPVPQKPKSNLLTRLLPSLGMLFAAGIMAFFGGAMIILSAISGTMAIVTAIIGYRQSMKEYQESTQRRINLYNAYIEHKCDEIRVARAQELASLERMYLSPEEELRKIESFSTGLFDRTAEDEDFLCVRLGVGTIEAVRKIDYKRQERLEIEDELQLLPERICESYRCLQNAPVVCDLKEACAVGVTGSLNCRVAILKSMVLDLVTRHYHSDVKLAFICEQEHAELIRSFRFLPNVRHEQTEMRMIVTDNESKTSVFELIYRELTEREKSKGFDSRLVIFVFDECGFNSHPISRYVENSKELGVIFVFFSESGSGIPLGCDALIQAETAGYGRLVDTHGEQVSTDFFYREISDDEIKRVVEILTPVYTEEISLESALEKNISLFQLLKIITVEDLDLEARWGGAKVFRSMAAPIGISKTGVVELNLHDKAHGPHGLVAGTTGSGKSELLQTYILSMATLYSPYEVAFVIIDFKGGGMANQFRNLPHLLGTITNIDGKETERSLKSIRAELQKRQRLFAEADVNHIDKYIKKYRSGEVTVAMPHLILVVDEFAELKAEQPEFMKELISAARIGRSLGVHLILATQKPSGQVNEQIWSNSHFKLCLKVQSREDSNEVLKSPLAAEIKEPGRAYLMVGNNEIFELFQSAYSGTSEKDYDSGAKDYTIYSISDAGRRTVVYRQKQEGGGENTRTQLEAIISYVAQHCEQKGLLQLPHIFLSPLEQVIDYPDSVAVVSKDETIRVPIGILDDPENQLQEEFCLNIGEQNLMIIGSAQAGKTNLLQVILRGIAERYRPEELAVYIIDFASMTLKNFEALSHVGGVVTSSEDEKLRNLLKMLFGEIESRKKKLLQTGVSSFTAYRESGRRDLPHIVLMIDNLTALKEMYFQDDSELLRLCREGISVGITIIVANSQTAGIGYKYLTNFSARIALFCNDSAEYGVLFDHCRERVEDIRGRCMVEIDKRRLDCQLYRAFEGVKEHERAESIRNFIRQINSRAESRAARIPEIPEMLTTAYITNCFSDSMQREFSLVLGLDYATVSPLVLHPASLGLLGVSGRAKSGKHNFIRSLVHLLAIQYPGKSKVYIIDGINKGLQSLKTEPNVVFYSLLADKAIETVLTVEAVLKQRYNALASGEEDVLADAKLLVVILNSPEAAEAVSKDLKAVEALRNMFGRYKNLNSFMLLGNYENTNVSYSAPELIKKVKDMRQFVFFDDLSNLKILDMPITTLREYKKPIELGDAFFIKENEVHKIKTART